MKTVLWLLFGFMTIGLQGQPDRGFQFIESSTGMNYPSWESGYTELEFADINMDGYVDILSIGDHGCPLIGSQEHGIMVWFGDGTGAWSAQMTGDFGYGGIAVGDVNHDGHWDVGYGMHHAYSTTDLGDQLVEVALGDGSGTTWIPWDDGLPGSSAYWGLFGTDFADVDNDGDLDLGTNSFGSGSGIHVYLNQADGSWIQSFEIIPGNSNMRFVFGDINNDGYTDFVVTHDAGIAFFGDGTGNFVNADYNLPAYSFPMTGPDLGDVNNDGSQDLAYVNPGGGVMVWVFDPLTNLWTDYSGSLPATGNFQEAQLCDFDGDGTMDLAAFGHAQLTVWSGSLEEDSITWTLVFNMTTSNNGNCAAFRAGGDVDRNGYPDMTLVEKEGSWPSDQNHLKCFKEATPYSGKTLGPVFPRGDEVFRQGTVQFIDWISAVPVASASEVQIDLSLQGTEGPWTNLTPGTANSGRFQWIVPQTISSNNCFIRYTLTEGMDTLEDLTPRGFTILGEDEVLADFMADPMVTYQDSIIRFTDQSLGLINSWQWDFQNDGTIDATTRNPEYSYTEPGIYSVKLIASDGSQYDTEIKINYINVLTHVAVEETHKKPDFSLRPNPCHSFLVLRYQMPESGLLEENRRITFELLDITGNYIMQLQHADPGPGIHEKKIEVSQLPAGIYLYRFQAGDQIKIGKIIRIN